MQIDLTFLSQLAVIVHESVGKHSLLHFWVIAIQCEYHKVLTILKIEMPYSLYPYFHRNPEHF